jgi:hypothetical protein
MLKAMIREFAQRMMDADVEIACKRGVRRGQPGPGELPQRLPPPGAPAAGRAGAGLGVDVTSFQDGAGWLAFLRGLAARGLSGVALVTSDDDAVLPGAAW